MSDASQRDGAGEARGPAPNNDKSDTKSRLLGRFMTTRLDSNGQSLRAQKKVIFTGWEIGSLCMMDRGRKGGADECETLPVGKKKIRRVPQK
jgi:hypothetical protein